MPSEIEIRNEKGHHGASSKFYDAQKKCVNHTITETKIEKTNSNTVATRVMQEQKRSITKSEKDGEPNIETKVDTVEQKMATKKARKPLQWKNSHRIGERERTNQPN